MNILFPLLKNHKYCVKFELPHKHEINIGDFVTILDFNTVIDVYFVKNIINDYAIIAGLHINEEKTDIEPEYITVELGRLIYLGDSYVKEDSALWNMRHNILSFMY